MKALARYAYLAAALTVIVYWSQRGAFDSPMAPWIAALIASLFAALGKGATSWRVWRRQRRRERQAQVLYDQLSSDAALPEAPDYVLYLRPFSTTGRLTVANPRRRWLPLLPSYFARPDTLEFETVLADAMPRGLTLVALGRPGEHVGAARIPVADADWRAAFRRLVEHARWIVMIPSHEGETRWEVKHLVDCGYLDRVVFLMPPQLRSAAVDLPSYWAQMRAGLAPIGLEMPAYKPAGLFFRCSAAGRATRARYVPRLSRDRLHRAFVGITWPITSN